MTNLYLPVILHPQININNFYKKASSFLILLQVKEFISPSGIFLKKENIDMRDAVNYQPIDAGPANGVWIALSFFQIEIIVPITLYPKMGYCLP